MQKEPASLLQAEGTSDWAGSRGPAPNQKGGVVGEEKEEKNGLQEDSLAGRGPKREFELT